MKRLLLIISVITIIGCNSKNNGSISGTIRNGEGTILYLEKLEVNQVAIMDSIKLEMNQQFAFKTKLENPELFILRNDKGKIINVLSSPGEDVSIQANYLDFGLNYEIKGSPESEKIQTLVLHLAKTKNKLDSIENEINLLEESQGPELNILHYAYQQSYIDQKRFTIRFIVENIRSLASVYALYQKLNDNFYILNNVNDFQYFRIVADSLSVYHPNSSLTQSLIEDVKLQEQQIEEEAKLNRLLSSAKETGFLDLAIPDVKGDTILLSSLQGKVALLIFWSSQNAQSIQSLLGLQSTYDKYHKRGFEVYAVSLDNQRSIWKSAIQYNQFNWVNVSELSYPNSSAENLYNVSTLPTNFLMNREGIIVTRDLYGKNLEIWLDNLL